MRKIIMMTIFFIMINILASETVIPSGSVSGIWNLSGSPYIIEGDIYLNAGDQLTIEAGVQVLWTEFDKFEVSGQLNIQGSLAEPVVISSYDADDFWQGLEFYQADQNSIIENALISNAGNGLYLDQSDITIINTGIFYESDASRLNTSDTGLTITQSNNSYLENCDITGYAEGIVIINDDVTATSAPVIVNTRVRNSAESDRAKSTGVKLDGVTTPTLDNCLIEGYQTGLDIANRTNTESTPVIINTRVRNSPETERNDKSTGIKCDGYVSFDLIDCELDHFDTGLNLKNNSLVYNTTPTLHGTRVRYSPESDRKTTVGLNIQGNISPSITSCDIIDYDKGITQKNNDIPVVVITVLTDTQIILAGEIDRAVTKGIEFEGYISFQIDNCLVEGYDKGVIVEKDIFDQESTPVIVNTRVRNSSETERSSTVGIYIENSGYLEVDNCDIEGYDQGIQLENPSESCESTPTLVNTRVRNSAENERSTSSGITADGIISVMILDCEVDYYDVGIELNNDSSEILSTPSLTNTRVRQSPESERRSTYGIKISRFVEPVIDNCDVEYYDVGIQIIKLERDEIPTTPSLTNTRVRNSPESSRDESVGVQIIGCISPVITNCEIDDYTLGLEIQNTQSRDESTTPSITNTRVRNSPETSRDQAVGIFLKGAVRGWFYNNTIKNCNPAVDISGSDCTGSFNYNVIYRETDLAGSIAIIAEDSDSLYLQNNTIAFYDHGFLSENAITFITSSIIWKYNAAVEPVSLNDNIEVSFSNVSRPGEQIYPGLENINQDPFFGGGGNRDLNFHLLPESPCIDNGDPELPPDPDGTIVDMGAFPYLTERVGETPKFNLISLNGNHPNPFNPATRIRFSVHRRTAVNLSIYNVKGQRINTLVDQMVEAGDFEILWEGEDENGRQVSSGLYFIKLQAGHSLKTNKAMMIK